MFIGHLPAGYLLGKTADVRERSVWGVVLICAVLPDFDLIWFYFVDDRTIHHHRYWVHAPLFWVFLSAAFAPFLWFANRRLLPVLGLALATLLLHCLLDTIAGGIMWGWPFSDHLFTLVEVPATYDHFVLSFLLHWTFAAELLVCLIAYVVWRQS